MLKITDDLEPILADMTLEEKVGQLLMIRPIEDQVRRLRPGSVIIKDDDVGDTVESAWRITDDMQRVNAEQTKIPMWIHGFVYRQPWAGPRDGEIAERYSPEEAEEFCFNLGRRWLDAGMHNYPSPTVNVHLHETGIMPRWAISRDPETVTGYSRAITRGLLRAGCGAMAQHFPAHGATELDSHAGVPTIDLDLDTIMRDHMPPYMASFEEGCPTLCIAHLKFPAIDPDENNIATTSHAILNDFLRDHLGFRGIAIADGVFMEGFKQQGAESETSVRAVVAGCDSICIPRPGGMAESIFEALLEAAASGRLPAARLDEAVMRNLAFKKWLGVV